MRGFTLRESLPERQDGKWQIFAKHEKHRNDWVPLTGPISMAEAKRQVAEIRAGMPPETAAWRQPHAVPL